MTSGKTNTTKATRNTSTDRADVRPCTVIDANEKRLETMRENLNKLEARAAELLNKGDNMTSAERLELLSFVNVAFHKSGKIEGAASVDGTAFCGFCEKMRNAAEYNPLIICGMCYAYADSWKEAARRRHQLNARILSSVLFSKAELETIGILAPVCRINEDGDISNATHARNVLRIIATHKGVYFGFWYKNASAVAAGLEAEGITTKDEKPRNACFVQSSVLIGFPAVPQWFTDVVFTVYPDKETTLEAIARGAHECNGRKCENCGWNCYYAKKARRAAGEVQHVAEYLRTNKEKRAAVIAAYEMKKAEVQ